MRQKEISSPCQDWVWFAKWARVLKAEGMSTDRQESTYSSLGKETLVDEVGAGPDP